MCVSVETPRICVRERNQNRLFVDLSSGHKCNKIVHCLDRDDEENSYYVYLHFGILTSYITFFNRSVY